MEQYWMPKKLDFRNLRLCLDNYSADFLHIGPTCSSPNGPRVNENLEGRTLDFKKDESGLRLFIDSREVFYFPLEDYQKGFSLEYERYESAEDGTSRMIIPSSGPENNPYDPSLPEPRRSILRIVLDGRLLEIFFKGKVNIKFHYWWKWPFWKYWTIVEPN